MLIVALWVLTMVFPKAGFYWGEIPVTIASIVVIIYASWHFVMPGSPPKFAEESRQFTRVHLVFVWLIAVSLLVNLDELTPIDATTWVLIGASPLAFHAGLRVTDPKRILVVILVSTAAVGMYAVVQNVFGVEETAIPGLTHVAGEDLIEDNPIRTPSGTLKSPSTYHNGNLAATFMLLGLGVAMFATRLVSRCRMIAVVAGLSAVAGVAVSLSRSAVFAVALATLVAMLPRLRPRWVGRRIAAGASVLCIAAGSLVVGQILFGTENFLIERFVGDAVQDPTAAGRTGGVQRWFGGLGEQDPGEFVITVVVGDGSVHRADDKLEGVLWLGAKYGFGAMLAFLTLVLVPARQIRAALGSSGTVVWFGLAASAAMWLVDNAFLFPPTLMNWFLVAGLSVQLSRSKELIAPTQLDNFVTQRRQKAVTHISEPDPQLDGLLKTPGQADS